ncbi:MAG: hypothetical protein V1809_15960 [Planctomycetota bacterium]
MGRKFAFFAGVGLAVVALMTGGFWLSTRTTTAASGTAPVGGVVVLTGTLSGEAEVIYVIDTMGKRIMVYSTSAQNQGALTLAAVRYYHYDAKMQEFPVDGKGRPLGKPSVESVKEDFEKWEKDQKDKGAGARDPKEEPEPVAPVATGGGGFIATVARVDQGRDRLIMLDGESRRLLVYEFSTSLKLRLVSVRDIQYDVRLQEYNNEGTKVGQLKDMYLKSLKQKLENLK